MSTEPIDDRSLRIPEFRKAEGNMSAASFYKMMKTGLGPKTTVIPGTNILIITPEARREWRLRITKYNEDNAEEIHAAQQARAARASRAGKSGASSPAHPSRRSEPAIRPRSATRGGR